MGLRVNAYLLVTLSTQQDFRCSVLEGAHAKGRAASSAKCALDDATETNICNLRQILSSIEQDVLGLEVHMNQLHGNS